MKVEYTEESPVRKSLAFEIEPEVVEHEIEQRAKHYAKRVKVPGFRPGKIPTEVVKQRFRGQVLEDVVETLVNRAVFKEIEDRGLRPLSTPKVEDLKIEENKPLTFRAVFETLPLIEVPEYKGLPVKARRAQVAEDAVDKEIDRLREDAARYDPIEGRAVQAGDHVMLDVTYTRDDGTTRDDQNVLVEVGAAENHKELNAALVGLSVGDHKDVTIEYADDHASEGLKGRTVQYSLTVKGVKDKVLPAADDEFAKDLGEFASLAELKDRMRRQLTFADERAVDREVKEALVSLLEQRASFEVPESLVERHMMARTRNAVEGLAAQGVDPRTLGLDWKQYHDAQRDEARRAAKGGILLDEIARREHIDASDAEIDAEVARFAARMKKPKEQVRAAMEKEGEIGGLRARIREEKTLDYLKSNARIETE